MWQILPFKSHWLHLMRSSLLQNGFFSQDFAIKGRFVWIFTYSHRGKPQFHLRCFPIPVWGRLSVHLIFLFVHQLVSKLHEKGNWRQKNKLPVNLRFNEAALIEISKLIYIIDEFSCFRSNCCSKLHFFLHYFKCFNSTLNAYQLTLGQKVNRLTG